MEYIVRVVDHIVVQYDSPFIMVDQIPPDPSYSHLLWALGDDLQILDNSRPKVNPSGFTFKVYLELCMLCTLGSGLLSYPFYLLAALILN